MPRRILVNYANAPYRTAQRANTRSALAAGGFDEVFSYGPQDIDPAFRRAHSRILASARGNGYWLWKPYFIEMSLRRVSAGDVLFYADSGSYFIDSIEPIVALSDEVGQDVMPFELPFIESQWTKRDAFILLGCDAPRFAETRQRVGGFSLWRASPFALCFAREWLAHAGDERALCDLPNQLGHSNYPVFREHRHDQSIFSLLSKKHRLRAFREPNQFGNDQIASYPDSRYRQLIVSLKGGGAAGAAPRVSTAPP